jgi:hypothetical protein
MDAAEEFNATFGQPYQRYDGKAADLTSKCQMLVLYKEFLDGCRGDLEEEFRIVGQRLHEISWVNPFPLGDSRRAALDTKRTFLPLKFLCFSNTLCYVFSASTGEHCSGI